VSGKAVLEAGQAKFAVAHNLKIGYLLFFKKLTAKEYRVVTHTQIENPKNNMTYQSRPRIKRGLSRALEHEMQTHSA
jgi:hypothetical protein